MSKELIRKIQALWFVDFKDSHGASPPAKDCDDEIRALITLANKAQLETLLDCFLDNENKHMYTTDQVRAIIKRCG